MTIIIFAGYIRGLMKLWFVGDEFAHNTFHHFKEMKNSKSQPQTFSFINYEVRDFSPADLVVISAIR